MAAKKSIRIQAYGCTSGSALSSSDLWNQIAEGRSSAQEISGNFPKSLKAHFWPVERGQSQKDKLVGQLLISWKEAQEKLNEETRRRIEEASSLGVILASTKGCIDDFIWNHDQELLMLDPLTPILEEFLRRTGLRPVKKICVSNACASGISSLYLAEKWLATKQVSDVLVLSCDAVGDFVLKGFGTLKVFTADTTRPFSQDRTGFFLGEASAAILLSNDDSGAFLLDGVGIDAEGFAVTRPSQSGASLVRAGKAIANLDTIDLVIAHGTATVMNDLSEDAAYQQLFSLQSKGPFITASKWAIGHTLGASSALDIILACECLAKQEVFSIRSTKQVDSKFGAKYITENAPPFSGQLKRAMVSSLGFGGLHAAVSISHLEKQ